jgi:hypothetical protein
MMSFPFRVRTEHRRQENEVKSLETRLAPLRQRMQDSFSRRFQLRGRFVDGQRVPS